MLTMFGCAGAQKSVKEETTATVYHQTPKTLAILPFENNSVTDPELYHPLTKGLSAMLITDLSNNVSTLKLIERNKVQSLLKEIALSQSGSIDKSTAIRAGKILGAQAITFGSFMVLEEQVRIDARIVKVETSEVLMAESILGRSDNFIDLER
jgi:TolB-like protein